MVHELFHVDAQSKRVSPETGHVYDRKIKVWNPEFSAEYVIEAYGPEFAKVLAKWTHNTGYWVATNGEPFSS